MQEPGPSPGPTRSSSPTGRTVKRRRTSLDAAKAEKWDQEPTATLSVSAPVRKKYGELLQDLQEWARRQRLSLRPGPALDRNLARYLNKLFEAGVDLGEGQKLLAAFKFSHPEFGKWGDKRLPRSTQTLSGWRKRNPPRSRLPLPWEAFAGILTWIAETRGQPLVAIALLLAFHAYLRPIDLFRLRVWQLVPPIARSRSATRWTLVLHPREDNAASKTGVFDESLILCDIPLYAKLAPLLGRLVHGRHRDEPLVQMPRSQVLRLVAQAAQAVGVSQLAPVLHSLRHGGPSADLAMKARSLDEAQKRGRWRTLRSVARYERGGRVAEQLQRLPRHVLAYLLGAERNLWTTLASR